MMANRMARRARWLVAGLGLVSSALLAAQGPVAGAAGLRVQFQSLTLDVRPGLGGQPLHVRVTEQDNVVSGEVHAVFAHGFDEVAGLLRHGGDWCEVVVLHPNVKACTHAPSGERERLVFYTGFKYYQPARLSRKHNFTLHVEQREKGYLLARLWPDPDKLMDGAEPAVIEAVALDKGHTGLRIYYRQRLSVWARMAAATYFATFGRDKVGFTVLDSGPDGRPAYVHGLVGAIERSIMRYFLAIQTHLDVRDTAAGDREQQRLAHWFALTERYPLQLYEMERASYIELKQREREQQRQLQMELKANVQ
jgi:hypothetical protein